MIMANEIKMEAEYRGYQIKWNDVWYFSIYAKGFEIARGIVSLSECQEWIDEREKQQFKRMPVLYNFRYGHERRQGEATSVVDDHHVWIVSGNDRQKASILKVWLDVPENRKALEEIKAKRQQVDQLVAEIEQIESSTKRLTAEMMVE
jgi:hypothetical protein